MSDVVLKVENLSKTYRLGEVGTGTISHDLNRWWAKIRGKEDPYSQVGQINDRTQKATSDYVDVLKDINFEVRQGEILGIIGKNGAGKSTLLKLISRITAPTSGSIKAKGRIASLLEVGTGMNPEMTARENIYLNGTILGMTKQEISSKFDEIIDFSGCAMFVDTPVKRFSSGMRVRLGFAVAAFLEPEILIVDEVLAVGDAEFQKKAIGKMKEVSQGGGRTVLFVSHNMASIQNLCSRTIVLDNGTVFFDGETSEAIEKYRALNIPEKIVSFDFDKEERVIKECRYKDFELLNSKGLKTNEIGLDEGLSFQMEIYSKVKIDVSLRITVFDSNDQRVFAFDSQDYHNFFSLQEQEIKKISCSLGSGLEVKPGSYYINISIKQGGIILDHIIKVCFFNVFLTDFYGKGRVSNSDIPLILKACSWT